jgi:hypothetical protein
MDVLYTNISLHFGENTLRPISKSLFGKVHTCLASRLSIRRIMATTMSLSLVCTFRS